jgi:hypothetical protein
MSDRPDFDPEKNFETIRAQWTKESHLSLPSKLETRLTLIEEQLSALFQLATKALGDTIDARIESDSKNSKLEENVYRDYQVRGKNRKIRNAMSISREFYECDACGTVIGWVVQKLRPRPMMPCPYCDNVYWIHLPERYLERKSTNIKTVDLVY